MSLFHIPQFKRRKKTQAEATFFNIYDYKAQIKWVFWLVALCLATLSLLYTNLIVNELEEDEAKQISIYSKALEFIVKPDVNEDLTFLLQEVVEANKTIPVILTDSMQSKVISYRNIVQAERAVNKAEKQRILLNELAIMKEQHQPIAIDYGEKQFIFFRNSERLLQLRFYPYIQLSVIAVFGFLTYLTFSYSRSAEQNKVWVGLAKETAHQLGTPLSALRGWVDMLKEDEAFLNSDFAYILPHLAKDIEKLEIVTARFSHIGSVPTLKPEDLAPTIENIVNYLEKRISSQIHISIQNSLPPQTTVLMDKYLFEWVIENICKNAVDAMPNGKGGIIIALTEDSRGNIALDIKDTGKGMSRAQMRRVFNPGYTTKKRGWGLGLTLAKRIIEQYHKGRIWVRYSEINKGTTFRILLPKINI